MQNPLVETFRREMELFQISSFTINPLSFKLKMSFNDLAHSSQFTFEVQSLVENADNFFLEVKNRARVKVRWLLTMSSDLLFLPP